MEGPIANLEQINEIFQVDSVYDVMKRLESANTEFSAATLETLGRMSPLSLAVVFEQIKRGRTMNLHDCFEMEFKMTQGFTEHGEFYEGVRALLVDKDRNPKWAHKSVHDVKPEEVDWFFTRPATLNLDIAKYEC